MKPFSHVSIIAVALLMAALGLVIVASCQTGRSAVDTVDQSRAQVSPTGQSGTGQRQVPTEEDVGGDRRATAEAVAADEPEGEGVEVLAKIKEMLVSDDAYVRHMGTTSVLRIAGAELARESGLRTAAQEDNDLRRLLVSNGAYHHESDSADREVRSEAILALGTLYMDMPTIEIETAITEMYAQETNLEVRGAMVYVLGLHEYKSQATRDVLADASDDDDPDLAGAAQGLLKGLDE